MTLFFLGWDQTVTRRPFPDHPLLEETPVTVASISNSPKPPPNRITLTYPVINAGECICSRWWQQGRESSQSSPTGINSSHRTSRWGGFVQVLAGAHPRHHCCRPQPASGSLHWFVDAAAQSSRATAVDLASSQLRTARRGSQLKCFLLPTLKKSNKYAIPSIDDLTNIPRIRVKSALPITVWIIYIKLLVV